LPRQTRDNVQPRSWVQNVWTPRPMSTAFDGNLRLDRSISWLRHLPERAALSTEGGSGPVLRLCPSLAGLVYTGDGFSGTRSASTSLAGYMGWECNKRRARMCLPSRGTHPCSLLIAPWPSTDRPLPGSTACFFNDLIRHW
jgi:hypothetical protein